MSFKKKVGLWLPPRKDLSASITPDKPAHIDSRIYELFLEYLKMQNVELFENLDFRKAFVSNHEVFLDNFNLSELDYFIWMGMLDRSFDSYHLEVLRVLGFSTIVCNSYEFYNIATDKFSAFSLLHKYKVPVSELYLINLESIESLKPLFKENTFLLKPRRSAFGQGIVKLEGFSQLRDVAEFHRQKNYYIEKYYENDLSEWTGVTVCNGEVLYGFRKKQAKISGWKVYDKDSLGGETIFVEPTTEMINIALRIGKILKANYFGLDFIKTKTGYRVVDINCSPGLYFDFIEDLKIPIAEKFFKMLNLE